MISNECSMMFFSKEASNKDQKIKTQMKILFPDDESKNTEHVWQESGFFDDDRSDLTIPKVNFPENTLCCVNQRSVSLVSLQGWRSSNLFIVCGYWTVNACH